MMHRVVDDSYYLLYYSPLQLLLYICKFPLSAYSRAVILDAWHRARSVPPP